MKWTRSRRISILCAVFSLAISAPAFSLDRDRDIGQFHYTFWSEKEGAPSQITALAQTEDGYLWIGSTGGLFRFDVVRFEEFTPQLGVDLPSHSVYSLMATPDGGLWVAFEPTGLGFIKNGSLTVFKQPGELPPSRFTASPATSMEQSGPAPRRDWSVGKGIDGFRSASTGTSLRR